MATLVEMLKDFLSRNRTEIVNDWINSVVATYPADSSNFLLKKKDQFHNPVGHAISEGLPAIIDQIFGDMDMEKIGPALDRLIRIRSVQDFSPAMAVQFLFDLKGILRKWMEKSDIAWDGEAEQLFDRVDRVSLFAFEIYTGCRDQMHEIRIREIKNRSARFFGRLNGQPDEGDEG